LSEPQTTGPLAGPQAASLAVRGGDVRGAIARASRKTGVDFDYLLAQARIESSLDPSARAATSSAAGLYQFTRGTWLQTLDRHGAEHGLGWAEAAISGGRVADPAMRAQILALRHDPETASLMTAELASDNRVALSARLGREPDAAELYLAHFLGIGGAGQMLDALQADPGRSAALILPQAAAANRPIFYDPSGAPRSVAEMVGHIRLKVGSAMEGGKGPGAWAETLSGEAYPGFESLAPGSTWGVVAGAAGGGDNLPVAAAAPQRPSMAQTLRDTFGLASGDSGSAPAFVHAAYGRLRSMGL